MAKHAKKPGRLRLSPRLEEREKKESVSLPDDPEQGTPRYHIVKVFAFFAVMAVMAVVVWILPLRSTYSELEKRELAKFPDFSFETLLSGDYFDKIGVWFSDTFPAREQLIELRGKWEGLYGIRIR